MAKFSISDAKPPKPAPSVTTAQRLASLVKSARDIMRKDKGLNGDLDRLPQLTWIMFLKFLDDLERVREEEAAISGDRFQPAILPPYRWRDWAADDGGITGDELLAFINQEEATRPDGSKGDGLFKYLRGLQGANGGDRRDVIATVFRGVNNRMISGYLLRDVINKVDDIHFSSSDELHTLGALYESMLREMRDAAGDSGEFYTPRPLVRLMVEVTNPRLGETVLDPACGTGGFLVEAFSHLESQCKTVADREQLQSASIVGNEAKPLPYLLAQMNLLLHGLESPRIDPGNSLEVKVTEIGDRERVDVILTNPPFGGEEERGILGNFPQDKQTAETALLFLQLIMRKLKRPGHGSNHGGRAAVVVPNGTLFGDGVAARIKEELLKEFNLHTILRLPNGVFAPYADINTNVLFFDRSGPTREVWYYEHLLPEGRKKYTKTNPLQFEEFGSLLRWWNRREHNQQAWKVRAADLLENNCNLDVKNPRGSSSFGLISPEELLSDVISLQSKTMAALEDLPRLFGSREGTTWTNVPLGEVLRKGTETTVIRPSETYREVTVRLWGKGVVLRRLALGAEIGADRRAVIRAGQFILSRIDARNGAFGIVPPELDGAVVSNDFPSFDPLDGRLDGSYLGWLSKTASFVDLCRAASEGTTNRVRLKEDLFLKLTIPLPSLEEQRLVVARAEAIASVQAMNAKVAEQLASTLESVLSRAFLGEL